MKNLFAILIIVGLASGVSRAENQKKYSAEKIIYDLKGETLELIGNAEVVTWSEKISGHRILLDLKSGKVRKLQDAQIAPQEVMAGQAKLPEKKTKRK